MSGAPIYFSRRAIEQLCFDNDTDPWVSIDLMEPGRHIPGVGLPSLVDLCLCFIGSRADIIAGIEDVEIPSTLVLDVRAAAEVFALAAVDPLSAFSRACDIGAWRLARLYMKHLDWIKRKTELYEMVIKNNIIAVCLLLEAGAWNNRVLYTASRDGRVEIVERLLAAGTWRADDLCDSFLVACEFRCFGIAARLLDVGADPHKDDDEALWHASDYGEVEIVGRLIEAAAKVGAANNRALIAAVENNHLDVVWQLLEAGADSSAREGRPLVIASRNGHLGIARMLLDFGADPSAQAGRALRYARRGGHDGIVELLEAAARRNDHGGAVESLEAAGGMHSELPETLVAASAE